MKYIRFSLLLCLMVLPYFSKAQQNEYFSFPSYIKEGDYVKNKIIIKLKSQGVSTVLQNLQFYKNKSEVAIQKICKENNIDNAPKNYLEHSLSIHEKQAHPQFKEKLSWVYTLEISEKDDLEEIINLLRQQPEVEYAEPIYTHQSMKGIATTFLSPNDTGIGFQYYLTNINAYNAWDIQTGSASMLIGITDDNFELTHSELSGKYTGGYDVADGDAVVTGATGMHGTEVSGIAAAASNNANGIAGIGYNCNFMPVKVAKNSSQTSIDYGYEGVLYAAQNGCKVINMSWGRTGKASQFELDYLKAIVDTYDVVLVAAGGQSLGAGIETYWYPASYNEVVLGVGGSSTTDDKWSSADYNDKLGICAPAENIYTTLTGNTYTTVSGTSYASPMVAGAAALLRMQYPSLKASQIIALLKANAKTVAANTNYPGKMGKGLLDIQAALLQNNQKYVALQKTWTTQASAASNTNLICSLSNQLNAVGNLNLTLSTASPYITIIKNTSSVGSMATLQSTTNQNDPFIINISGTMPVNTAVTFQIVINDGAGYNNTEFVTLVLNPTADYLNIALNQLIFSKGSIGNMTMFDPTTPNKLGLRYKNYTMLADAGLIIALNSSKVSNTVKIDKNSVSQSFNNVSTIKYTGNNLATYQEASSQFEDVTNNANRVGVEVFEKTYAWRDSPNDKFVIIEYQIRNISTAIIDNMYVGLFANWDIQNGNTNIAGWDAANQLGYIYQNATGGLYGGICVLTNHSTLEYYAIDNDGYNGSIRIDDGFLNSEKFQSVSSGTSRTSTNPSGNDVSHVVGAKLQDFQVGQTKTISFALIAGDNLSDIQASAKAARNQFKLVKTSPVPTVNSGLTYCKGSNVLVRPGNGTNFKFYNALPLGAAIATGNSLQVNNLTSNSTYYITGIDSLYESSYQTLVLTVDNLKSNFTMSKTSLDLFAKDTLVSFQNTTANATVLNWDLGNGTSSTLANPTAVYKTPGLYTIRLITQNATGCKDTLTKQLTVNGYLVPSVNGSTVPVSPVITALPGNMNDQPLLVYPNPTQNQVFVRNSNQYALQCVLMDANGRVLKDYGMNQDPLMSFQLPELTNGMYLFYMKWPEGFYTEKLLIQR